jgi:methyl-accepting chemotaxis protein
MSDRLSALAGDDQRLGRLFTNLGVGGLVASLVAGVLGLVVVVALTSSADQSLAVTVEAVETADETVALAADTLGIVSESFDTLVPSAELAAATFNDAATVIADTTVVVTVDVPDALDAVVDAMPAIETTAEIIDNALRVLSFVGVDYDPEVPFGEAVAELTDAIDDLPDELRAQAVPLASLAADFEEFGVATVEIADDLAELQSQMEEAELLLDSYAATAGEATEVVTAIRDDLGWQRWLMVLVVVLVTGAFAATQAVPILLGRRFADRAAE